MTSTVILGAGIIGVSTAYYLSEHQPGSTIHLVDPSPELFSSASGFAGGFLAKDWFQPAVSSLGALSFEQHRLLAEKYGGRERWGYAGSTSVRYSAGRTAGGGGRGDDWLRGGSSRAGAASGDGSEGGDAPGWLRLTPGDEIEVISQEGETAQVEPLALCQFILSQCLARGVQLHHPATALSTSTDVRDELASVRIADTDTSTEIDLPATRVIIAAGVWSGRVFGSLFRHSRLQIPVSCLAGHSLVVTSPRWKGGDGLGCHAVFTSGTGFCPEVFSRVNGEIYIAGLNTSSLPLQDVVDGFKEPDPAALDKLKETARELLGVDGGDDLVVVREGLCFRPVTPSGRPIICRVPDEELGIGVKTRKGADGGVFVATGHGPWGISLSLGTGMVLAEIVQGRERSADVGGLGL